MDQVLLRSLPQQDGSLPHDLHQLLVVEQVHWQLQELCHDQPAGAGEVGELGRYDSWRVELSDYLAECGHVYLWW